MDDVAVTVSFLAREEAAFVTGLVISVTAEAAWVTRIFRIGES